MKTLDQLTREGLIKKLTDNFPDGSISEVQQHFESDDFIGVHSDSIPIYLSPDLIKSLKKSEEGINLLDLGCGQGNQIVQSTWYQGLWSVGLDISRKILDEAAHNLRGTWYRWHYKKAVALVHADIHDPLKSNVYTLLDQNGIFDRIQSKNPKRLRIQKTRKIEEVREVFEGKHTQYFDIITCHNSFPGFTSPEHVETTIKFYKSWLKSSGLWYLMYEFEENPSGDKNDRFRFN